MTLTVRSGAFDQRIISPELVLVDTDLAADARMLLPGPGELEGTHRTAPAVGAPRSRPVSSPKREAEELYRRKFTGRSRLAAVAARALAALVVGVFGVVLAAYPPGADTIGAGADRLHAAAQAARQAREARTYTWTAVPSAAAYQFEILRGEDAVFEATTTDLSVELPAHLRLSPGHYTWSVTPTFENQSAVLLRRPVVEATFEVAAT